MVAPRVVVLLFVLTVTVVPTVVEAQSFSDQTAAAGLSFTSSVSPDILVGGHYAGGAIGDFNRDGAPDIFLLGGGGVADALYINDGDGSFTEQAAAWGLDAVHRGRGASVADYNGDGWHDIYLTSGGDMTSIDRPGQHRLYRNNGDGSFTNVAVAAEVEWSTSNKSATSAGWGDYDLDGDLDLMVMTWSSNVMANRLFQNDGDGTFTDVTSAAGLLSSWGYTPLFADINGDRYPELLLINDWESSEYYLNDGDGTFTNWTAQSGIGLEDNGMGSTIADFNRDGLQDWFCTSIFRDDLTKDGNYLYVNQGGNSFAALPHANGVQDGGWGWGTVAFDFDHDSHVDLAETNGWDTAEHTGETSYLYRNNGDMTFTRSAMPVTTEGRSLMTLDYDLDGDLDFLITAFDGPVSLWRNDVSGPGTGWIEIVLDTGGTSGLAPDGIGTRITAQTGAVTQSFVMTGGGTYLGQSQLVAHFGLGNAGSIDELTFHWANGDTTVWSDLPANRIVTVAPSIPGSPGESSNPIEQIEQMRAGFDRTTGKIELIYTPACGAVNHTVYYGDLASVGSGTYSGAVCGAANSGATSFHLDDPENAFFLIVGNTGLLEGTYGRTSAGAERAEDTATAGCDLPRDLSATCD